jgi:hypothetical protein
MKIPMIHSWIKNEVKWIFAKLEENASVRTNAFSERNKKTQKNNEKNYMDKNYSENQVVEMHYVEHFIMSLIINKLI